jgi:HK97 family phage major capsid protein
MPDVDNAAVIAALENVNKSVTAMRAEIDGMKKPVGRTSTDVVQREKIDRINAAVGNTQDVLDRARRARANAQAARARIEAKRVGGAAGSSALDLIRAARAERPAGAIGRRISAAVRPGNRMVDHLTGEPLTSDQLNARAEYTKRFMAWTRSGNGAEISRLAPQAAMQTQISEKGGFLVPVEMETAVIQLGGLYSAMRMLCDVRPITQGSSLKQPVNVQGATFGWVGELATRSETSADDLAMLEWHLMECYAQPKVTNTLLSDAAFDVEGWLNDGISREFAEGEAAAFISGGGTNAPRGLHSYTMIADASWAWGKFGYLVSGVPAALTDSTHNGVDALIDVVTATHRRYLPAASWLMNRTTQATIRKIKDTTGQYIWQQPITADQPSLLLGFPCETDDNMPSIGANTYPIQFGDHAQAYRIVDKPGMSMLRDEVTDKGRTIFYTTKRVGGGAKNFEAMKFLKIAA